MHQNSRSGGLRLRSARLFFALVLSVPFAAQAIAARPAPAGGDAHRIDEGRLRGGDFRIDGAPRGYEARKSYRITVSIVQPGQTRCGFDITARFADSGKQAGSWGKLDNTAQIRSESDIQYVTVTAAAPSGGLGDGSVEFQLQWTAPETTGGPIVFSGTGHAFGDGDAFSGEFVYTAGAFSRPSDSTAQSEPEEVAEVAPSRAPARLQETSRIIDLPAPVDLGKHSMEILIQHRFLDSVADAGAGQAFGIDSGANMSIGMNYGITNRLSAGVARTRFDQIVELSGTYEIRTAKESWWKLGIRGGVEGKRNFHQEYSPFLQAAASFDYRRLRFNVVPTASFRSRPDPLLEFDRLRAIHPGSNSTFALGLGADFALNRRLSLLAEWVPRLAGYGGLDRRRDQVGVGFIIRTWGHVFTIEASSSRDFTPSKYAVNAEDRSLSLGFNLYRRMR